MNLSKAADSSTSGRIFGHGAHDLLVVGAGGLGGSAARQWQRMHPDALVMCATWSDERHDKLRADGLLPILSSDELPPAPFVLFCAPPSPRQDIAVYCHDVRRAASAATRRFIFTSATSVYVDYSVVREDSPLALTPRARRMRAAEESACAGVRPSVSVAVLRLGLLYNRTRGAHAAFLAYGSSQHGPESIYNVVHYDDAAAAAVAALRAPPTAGDAFIAVDGQPITAGQMVSVARRHPLFSHVPLPEWGTGGYQKVVDGSHSWQALNWRPRWTNFQLFFEADARVFGSDGVLATSD